MDIHGWLETIPPVAIYSLVCLVILVETTGVPLPGEVVLVSASLMAAQGHVSPLWVAVWASVGAVVGDSIGYLIGRKGGRSLFTWLGRKFPKHISDERVAVAERSFERWGAWAVFFGRFVALLRILSGPLAGVLRMPYWKFLAANVPGGILWAGGTAYAVYAAGMAAEAWLKRFSWVGLIIAALAGLASLYVIKRRSAAKAATKAATGTPGSARPGGVADAQPEPVPATD